MTQTDNEAGTLRAILADPADDTARLVYADALDEADTWPACPACSGIGIRGTTWSLRYTGHDYREVVDRDRCSRCRGTGRASDGRAARAEFIRLQIGLVRLERIIEGHPGDDVSRRADDKADAIRRRERELLSVHGRGWVPRKAVYGEMWKLDGTTFSFNFGNGLAESWTFSRGFIGKASCVFGVWQEHGPALVAAHPIERVDITDMPIFPSGGNNTYFVGGLGRYPVYYWGKLDHLPSEHDAILARSAVAIEWARSEMAAQRAAVEEGAMNA
jgi:uncharacterized protein (TIGR02996 family)